jgi:hypothetical protein
MPALPASASASLGGHLLLLPGSLGRGAEDHGKLPRLDH